MKKIFDVNKINTVVVHNGMFHLDDVLVAALVKVQFPDVEIIRNNKPDLDQAGPENGVLIADVGMTYEPQQWLFDHHMDHYTTDSDPETVHAAVGRVWNALGLVSEYPTLTAYIKAVDLHDTGVSWTPLGVVGSFAPNWDDEFTLDEGFERAVQHVQNLIEQMIRKDESARRASEELAKYPIENNVLVLDRFMPWQEFAIDRGLTAVITPGRDAGTWQLNIPKGMGTLPEEWLTSKPSGLIFMPAWRTMAVCDSLERANHFAAAIVR